MGINRLLPQLEGVLRPVDLDDLEGKRAGIDISGWMYKFSCQYIFNLVYHLETHGVKCYLVFDGDNVEAKRETTEQRQKARERKLLKAEELVKDGKLKEAAKMKKSCVVTSTWQCNCIKKWCKSRNVAFVQAPFEADHQLTFMMKNQLIDFVITDDSDFIAHGCATILYKLRKDGGELFQLDTLQKAWDVPFDLDSLLAACILCGCDYWKGGLHGFGPVAFEKLYKMMGRPFCYEEMVSHLNATVDKAAFDRAWNTFKYQVVFDTRSGTLVPLSPYPEGKDERDFPYAGTLAPSVVKKCEFFNPKISFLLPEIGRPIEWGFKTRFCVHCPKVCFASRGGLLEHRQVEHLTCKYPACGKTFKFIYKLKDHSKIHAEIPTFAHKCKKCGKGFLTLKKRDAHMKTHATKSHKCPTCNQGFSRKHHLNRHKKIHSEKKTFLCRTCGKGFKQRDDRNKHELIHSDIKPYLCCFCGKGFCSFSALTLHETSRHGERVECPFCGKKFTKGSLLAHQIRCKCRKNDETSHKVVQRVQCPKCGKEMSRCVLHRHMKKTCNRAPRQYVGKRCHCPQCGNEMAKNYLSTHLKICKSGTIHETSHKDRIQCPDCGKDLAKHSLRGHKKSCKGSNKQDEKNDE